jgi:DNA-binding FadR family transcriptional regulator
LRGYDSAGVVQSKNSVVDCGEAGAMNTAERIYAASTCDGEAAARQAEALARRIEDDIADLGLIPGASFGSLRELAERYHAGRSVVREAVGILERRGLGRLRPGPCGGFILARPGVESIAAALTEHFLARAITPQQLHDARAALELLVHTGAGGPVVPLLAHCVEHLDAVLREEREGVHVARASGLPAGPATRAVAISRQLAAEIQAARGTGTRLGSEWQLGERFQVSRLTVRQAIRLLQDSGLVECRRGRGNGLVIHDRRTTGNIRLVLAYLIGEQLDPMTVGTILFQLNAHVPALAVSRADAAQRRQLESWLARLAHGDTFERYDLLGLVHCVARLADSPIVDLFSRCLAAYEARFHASLAERLDTAAHASYFHLVRRLLDQMHTGDSDELAWAKQQSAACMLEMSVQRPI